MNAAAQLFLQSLIDQSVAFYQWQTIKLGANDQDAEVRFRAGRHGVHVALVVDLQVVRLQCSGQFGCDGPLNGPARVWVHVWSEVGQRPV